jgi:hypothetical protein
VAEERVAEERVAEERVAEAANAASALMDLEYSNDGNQVAISQAGAIPHLMRLWRVGTGIDRRHLHH